MPTQITIEDIIQQTSDLPVMSSVALRVMREADNSNTTAARLSHWLGQDPALSSRVLRLSNSAYYGLSRKVNTIQDAVVILGLRCVRNLAMVAATYPWLSKPLEGYGLAPLMLWQHSHSTALGSQYVAQKSGRLNPDVAFTGGLLHDIGKLALNASLDRKADALARLADLNGWTFVEAERTVLGFDHGQVGGHLAEKWNLPQEMVDSARFHHEPDRAETPSLVADAVHVGNYLTMALGFGLGVDGLKYALCDSALLRLGLTPEDLDYVADELEREFWAQTQSVGEMVA
ncbi:MAG: HDOD domain-containing protein [Fimbriimonadaceae bacterium]|nr:HDOD domain-containing protein [Fimbriimonadaceae bacterium]